MITDVKPASSVVSVPAGSSEHETPARRPTIAHPEAAPTNRVAPRTMMNGRVMHPVVARKALATTRPTARSPLVNAIETRSTDCCKPT